MTDRTPPPGAPRESDGALSDGEKREFMSELVNNSRRIAKLENDFGELRELALRALARRQEDQAAAAAHLLD